MPTPSSEANGPHGLGTIQTCSIGVLLALLVPGGHELLTVVNDERTFC